MKKRLVMIGNGMAGIRCMEEILKHDSDSYEITILEMNRIQTTTALCFLMFYKAKQICKISL